MTEAEIRSGLEQLMKATLADEAAHHDWTYRAVRPMPVPPSWHAGQRVVGDCSKGVQYLCRWNGHVLDPMNMDWGVYGNSTTICLYLEHIELSEVQIGDAVTFGTSGDEHAAMVIRIIRRNKKIVDLELWSFGHPGSPNTYLLSQDGREYQLLRLHLGPHKPPTAQDILRAKTGYWAWRQWRLGTGAWRGYGKRNRKVRPDVPRRIPRAWWRRLIHSTVKSRKRRGNTANAGG